MTIHPERFFHEICDAFPDDLAAVLPEDAVVFFDLEGPGGGGWAVTQRAGALAVRAGKLDGVDCRVRCSVAVFAALVEGRLSPLEALAQGLVAVEGDVGLVLDLRSSVFELRRRAS
jgi:hypothetical protein